MFSRLARVLAAVSLAFSLAVPAQAQSPAPGDGLHILAAASLTDAIDEILVRWQAQGGPEATPVYAASSALARQIEQGAPADIFISANEQWMDYLAERDLVDGETRVDLLTNRLVLVAPRDADIAIDMAEGADLAGALNGGRLAVGDPEHVPAGIYAKAALESLGLWESVEPSLARAENVRAALALVSRREAPLAIVYRSDAAVDPEVKIVATFPEDSHPKIVYPAAVMEAAEKEGAGMALDFLRSDIAAEIFERYGLTVLK